MRALISLLLLSLLTACGQKGPLYFAPKDRAETATTQPQQAEPADSSEQDDASEQD